jgi:signal transduction histidine kinase
MATTRSERSGPARWLAGDGGSLLGVAAPLWWRIPMWALLTALTALTRHDATDRIAVAVLMGGGALAFQLINHDARALRAFAIIAATVGSLGACLLAPSGAAEVLLFVAASRAGNAFEGRALRWFVVLDTVATALTIGYITRSFAGLLAGAGVPLLVQRSIEHRDLVRERDRATALLAEVQRGRESEAQAAALQERGRIAREMHDVLAHSLAGLSVQLQALRTVAAREGAGPALVEPLDRAATLAREGLAEARAAVSTLRDPVGLGLDELPALVDRHPGATHLAVEGSPGTVDPATGHAVYRAVQESLTNAARYAPGSPVEVVLAWSPGTLTATVRDSGPAPDRQAVAGQGTGLGIAGMDERITQVAGTLHVGPSGDGGWQVAMTVPVRAASEVPG